VTDRWSAAHRSVTGLAAEAEAAFAAELDAGRKTLARVALGEDFRRGVQLSGPDVLREVTAYAADPFDPARKPSRRRRAERTITSYAYRIVFKPSPFGSFTEIGARPWSGGREDGGGEDGGRVTSCRLSVGLLAWMADRVTAIDGAEEIVRVRINNTLVRGDGRARFLRRPLDGAADAGGADRVVDARDTALVGVLVDALSGGPLSERELRDRLAAAGVPDPADTIRVLAKAGLCHRGFGMPDQTVRGAEEAARLLRGLHTDQARWCAEQFDRAQAVEDAYPAASAEQRTGLLAELREVVHALAAEVGCPPPPDEALRAAMYEDVGTRAPARTWRPDAVQPLGEDIALVQRVLPVLDEGTIEKLGLFRFCVDRFGGADTHILDVYRAFSALAPTEAGAVMSGVGDDAAVEVRALRAEVLAWLGELAASDTAEIHLDRAVLRAFAEAAPASAAPWRSTALRVQFDGDLVVVNGATTGHGVFFSRYCDLLEPDSPADWSLRAALEEHIRATTPGQTDITAALGLNFNLHPRLTPRELVYPGSVARPGARGTLTLADLVVRPDHASRRLTLVSAVDGAPIDLVPLNFLHPAAAPGLYRFLCAFAPARTYRGGLWEQLDRADRTRAALARPRVRLGRLVLDRRSWRFDLAALPALSGLENHDLTAVAAFERWRTAAGLPRHGFFRVVAARATSPDGERDLLAETRQWALEARSARLHKPHYLDTRNPFLLAVLARQIRETERGWLVVQECLPAPGGAAAEEFFIEHTLEDPR
jgi:hypothetical protein